MPYQCAIWVESGWLGCGSVPLSLIMVLFNDFGSCLTCRFFYFLSCQGVSPGTPHEGGFDLQLHQIVDWLSWECFFFFKDNIILILCIYYVWILFLCIHLAQFLPWELEEPTYALIRTCIPLECHGTTWVCTNPNGLDHWIKILLLLLLL